MKKLLTAMGATGVIFATMATNAVADDGMRKYEVSVTNLTRGTLFTPVFAATHRMNVSLYQLGQPASDELAALAEGGDTAPLSDKVGATKHATTQTGPVVLAGKTEMFHITARKDANRISVASMMVPTNDGFIAVNNMPLPMGKGQKVTYLSNGHDAGSEPNDELCISIPGPQCGGEGGSPGVGGEGYVHIHAGIHGIGNLNAADYDWRNPVARITVRRTQ